MFIFCFRAEVFLLTMFYFYAQKFYSHTQLFYFLPTANIFGAGTILYEERSDDRLSAAK